MEVRGYLGEAVRVSGFASKVLLVWAGREKGRGYGRGEGTKEGKKSESRRRDYVMTSAPCKTFEVGLLPAVRVSSRRRGHKVSRPLLLGEARWKGESGVKVCHQARVPVPLLPGNPTMRFSWRGTKAQAPLITCCRALSAPLENSATPSWLPPLPSWSGVPSIYLVFLPSFHGGFVT